MAHPVETFQIWRRVEPWVFETRDEQRRSGEVRIGTPGGVGELSRQGIHVGHHGTRGC